MEDDILPKKRSWRLSSSKTAQKTTDSCRNISLCQANEHYSAQLVFQTGVDTKLFALIAEKVKSLSEEYKYCTLTWDEVSLKAHLDYSVSRDEIDGFVDMLDVRRAAFATHALTFMIRGIKIPFKQPIGYFFTHGLKHFELAEMIALITKAVLDTGILLVSFATA